MILEGREWDAHHSFLLFCKLTGTKAAQREVIGVNDGGQMEVLCIFLNL